MATQPSLHGCHQTILYLDQKKKRYPSSDGHRPVLQVYILCWKSWILGQYWELNIGHWDLKKCHGKWNTLGGTEGRTNEDDTWGIIPLERSQSTWCAMTWCDMCASTHAVVCQGACWAMVLCGVTWQGSSVMQWDMAWHVLWLAFCGRTITGIRGLGVPS